MSERTLRSVCEALIQGELTRCAADELLRTRATPKQLREFARLLVRAYNRRPYRLA